MTFELRNAKKWSDDVTDEIAKFFGLDDIDEFDNFGEDSYIDALPKEDISRYEFTYKKSNTDNQTIYPISLDSLNKETFRYESVRNLYTFHGMFVHLVEFFAKIEDEKKFPGYIEFTVVDKTGSARARIQKRNVALFGILQDVLRDPGGEGDEKILCRFLAKPVHDEKSKVPYLSCQHISPISVAMAPNALGFHDAHCLSNEAYLKKKYIEIQKDKVSVSKKKAPSAQELDGIRRSQYSLHELESKVPAKRGPGAPKRFVPKRMTAEYNPLHRSDDEFLQDMANEVEYNPRPKKKREFKKK